MVHGKNTALPTSCNATPKDSLVTHAHAHTPTCSAIAMHPIKHQHVQQTACHKILQVGVAQCSACNRLGGTPVVLVAAFLPRHMPQVQTRAICQLAVQSSTHTRLTDTPRSSSPCGGRSACC